jgi:hypothetical protein
MWWGNMPYVNQAQRPAVRAGFRVEPFAAAAGWSRAHCYNLMSGKVAGAPPLPFIKSGKARVITISPQDYLALCAEQAGA